MTAVLACGLPDTVALHVAGADRASFLHRLLTADIATLTDRPSRPCLLLDTKGRVQASMEVVATPEAVVAFASRESAELVTTSLHRYVLGADVTFNTSSADVIGLRGDAVATVLDTAMLPEDAIVATREGMAFIATTDLAGALGALIEAGAMECDAEGWEAARIAAAEPAQGTEITGREFPQELGLVSGVDFDKGCYLGQETVARIHYRGQVNRLLAVVEAAVPLAAGDELCQGDAVVGAISSAAGRDGEWLGLVLLPREAAAPGTALRGPEDAAVSVQNNAETHPNATTVPPAS
jgi:folate-binding protein YgfZ